MDKGGHQGPRQRRKSAPYPYLSFPPQFQPSAPFVTLCLLLTSCSLPTPRPESTHPVSPLSPLNPFPGLLHPLAQHPIGPCSLSCTPPMSLHPNSTFPCTPPLRLHSLASILHPPVSPLTNPPTPPPPGPPCQHGRVFWRLCGRPEVRGDNGRVTGLIRARRWERRGGDNAASLSARPLCPCEPRNLFLRSAGGAARFNPLPVS